MKKRIYGLETEYGINLVRYEGLWSESSLPSYLTCMKNICIKGFMSNGSRIYEDVGHHPEYCTAECLGLADLIAQDKAGEKILDDVFRFCSAQKQEGRVYLFKNNVQHGEDEDTQSRVEMYGNLPITFGCHENFSMARFFSENDLAPVFVPLLVVRQIIAGSGWVANANFQEEGIKYEISQRARFIGSTISEATHGGWKRAILCTARWNEPHADKNQYKRLHLIIGDSNMSELSTYLKVATVGILLEMMENGFPLKECFAELMPEDPVCALKLVSRDLTCQKPVIKLVGGRNFSAINLFWEIVDIMERYRRNWGLNPELSVALDVLIDVLRRLERRQIDPVNLMEVDSQGLDEELDWLIKKTILEDSLLKFGCDWSDFFERKVISADREVSVYDQIRVKDKKYHDISEEGLYNIFTQEPDLSPAEMKKMDIRTPRMVEKERIEYMKDNPPQNTRAKIRGELIQILDRRGLKERFNINWNSIYVSGVFSDTLNIHLDDPFETKNKQVENAKKALQ